jgi:hypothetical protein
MFTQINRTSMDVSEHVIDGFVNRRSSVQIRQLAPTFNLASSSFCAFLFLNLFAAHPFFFKTLRMNIKRIVSVATVGFALLLNSSTTVSAESPATNSTTSWLDGKHVPRLSFAQADAFAQQHQRRAEALLAAYQASNDRAFLREAMATHPRDPRVALAAACPTSNQKNPSEDVQEQRRWLDTLKQAAPDNALAHYLSARAHFRAGQADVAEQEIFIANEKTIRDYAPDWLEHTEAAYRSASYSESQAKALAMITFFMPHLARLRDLGTELVSRANSYRQKDNALGADRMLGAAVKLGRQLDRTNSLTVLENLIGIVIQLNALKSLDPSLSFGDSGEKVQEQMDRLSARRDTMRRTAQTFDKILETMSDKDVGNYFELQKRIGENAAERQVLRARGLE